MCILNIEMNSDMNSIKKEKNESQMKNRVCVVHDDKKLMFTYCYKNTLNIGLRKID